MSWVSIERSSTGVYKGVFLTNVSGVVGGEGGVLATKLLLPWTLSLRLLFSSLLYEKDITILNHSVILQASCVSVTIEHFQRDVFSPTIHESNFVSIHTNWFDSESTKAGRPSYHSL